MINSIGLIVSIFILFALIIQLVLIKKASKNLKEAKENIEKAQEIIKKIEEMRGERS